MRTQRLRATTTATGAMTLAWIERHLGVTPAGVALVAACLTALPLARLLESRGLSLLVYAGILWLAAASLMGRRRLAVDARRDALPTRVRVGQAVDTTMRLEAARGVSSVVFEEHLPDDLGRPVRLPVPRLSAGEAVEHPYSFVPKRRGIFDVGPLTLEWSDPFGLTRRRIEVAAPDRIIVHPVLEPVSDRVTSREWEDPPVRPPLLKPWPTGFEFYGMRDYVPGDDPRRIVWRSVMRTGKLLVREAEQGVTDRIRIWLDTDVATHSPGDASASFEKAVSAAASLAVRHLEDGFAVTVETNDGTLVDSARGRPRRMALLDALAGVGRSEAPFERSMDRLLVDRRSSTHNLVVTPHVSSEAASRLRVVRERGTALLLVHVLWEDTDPASVHRAGTVGCPVVEVAPGSTLGGVFAHVVGGRR